ncbi:hypothetical protein NQ314_012848 [Rhamnusium bicolor]|uniref:Uncharacterized protein n=1 Tax=Rhamnusium bicolor TaxID=1586634 RepID=A0AAV8X902_9CUCU|nr:hypothetical protein NQ314_012848 [Rhamnusium bicolor]
METYPPRIQTDFMGASAPLKTGHGATGQIEYFQEYRNETISRMKVPPYDWGMSHIPYTPHPDVSISVKSLDKYLKLPQSQFSMLDPARQQEVDDFYLLLGGLNTELNKYMKYPDYHVKYKQPISLPLTLERSLRTPSLPERALTGVYSPGSDRAYKR